MSARTRRWYHVQEFGYPYMLRTSVAAVLFMGGLAVAIAVVVALVNAGARTSCRQAADAMGVDWRYGFFTGCLVEVDAGWVPLDNLRFNADGTVAR